MVVAGTRPLLPKSWNFSKICQKSARAKAEYQASRSFSRVGDFKIEIELLNMYADFI